MSKRLIKPASLYVDLNEGESFTGLLTGISETEGNFGMRKTLDMRDAAGRDRKMGVGGYLNQLLPDLNIGQFIEIKRTKDRPTTKGAPMKTYDVRQWPVEEHEGPPFDVHGEAPPEADETIPF
jgi:hypothetical protein